MMDQYPLAFYIPPTQWFEAIDIDTHLLIKKLLSLLEKLDVDVRGFLEWVEKVLGDGDVEGFVIYGSSVYRIDDPEDITDVDIFLFSRKKDIYSVYFSDYIPEELKKVLHPQVVSLDRKSFFPFEVAGMAGPLVVLKESEGVLEKIESARRQFGEEDLVFLILRDMLKILKNEGKRKKYIPELDGKIASIRFPSDNVLEESLSFSFASQFFRRAGLEKEDMEKLSLAAMKRRKIKAEFVPKIKGRIMAGIKL